MKKEMETSRKWVVGIVALVVVDLLIVAAFAYLLLREDEEEQQGISVIGIGGSSLATSKLVDHGSGTPSDPYVITGLDVVVRNSPYSPDKYGIGVTDVDAHLIISGTRIHTDYVSPGYRIIGIGIWNSRNVTILDCRFENLTIAVKISHSTLNVSYSTFESCSVGISMDRLESVTDPGMMILGNTFQNTDWCIEISSNWFGLEWGDVVIVDNSMGHYLSAVGIYGGGNNFTITGNDFYDGTEFAIEASKLSASAITDNKMAPSYRDGGGIALSSSSDVRIEGNTIMVSGPGISVESSSDIRISNNSINIPYHSAYFPAQFGVLVRDSLSINMTYNKIGWNTVGVMILSSDPNSTNVWIHHNEFSQNLIQAMDNSGSTNHWDDGVGAGNYWGDYAGLDVDHDGIGDTPEIIDEDSADRYPLIVSPI